MKKIVQLLMVLCLFAPSLIHAQTNTSDVKIAFIRDGYLWVKVDDKEEETDERKSDVQLSSPMVFRWKPASLSKRSGWQYNRYERHFK